MKRFVLGLSLWLAADGFGLAQVAPLTPTDLFGDPVLARGKGVEVRQSELEERYLLHQSSVAARGGAIRENERDEIEKQLLDKAIIHEILLSRATDEDKAKARERVGEMLEELRGKARNEASFQRQLVATGMNEEQLRDHLYENAVNEILINKELRSSVEIEEEAIRTYYEEQPDEFKVPIRVRAAHILVSNKDAQGRELQGEALKDKLKKAEQLRDRARQGEDFDRLVRMYSDDKTTSESGGVYTFARKEMLPRFSAAAFSLKEGQISDIVETQFGFHVIKLHEQIPSKTLPLEEVEDNIRQHLTMLAMQKKLPEFLKQIKEDANVEILKDPAQD